MPSPTLAWLESPETQLVKQGAEAKVYKSFLHPNPASSEPILLKYRFKKNYRHAILDTTLTKARVAGEARALMKCLRSGVQVPGIRMVDASEGVIGIEWIEGKSVRSLLGADEESDIPDENINAISAGDDPDSVVSHLAEYGLAQPELMTMIGVEIAKMHKVDVVHGDLTTSNMMLRKRLPKFSPDKTKSRTEVILIDFGLSFISALVEDKAVDLYVLERAFASTHPDSEPLFELVLDAYAAESGKGWQSISKKLDEVRLRGRKRSMVG
ncbi:uncharacterized protein FOMMEDRAFT_169910 [Fomitiporia mediterranea MF3/22]|uniref:uncharacterized protein n=1 Tax=Fomitiporia mediterranea (strain MF3/22) TaxID=694068 RepID=UPI000440949C|nr:uncharacterized protein FOMMEDRAFT_169910 [Fomitiporia mediterranea MF3/22]EJD00465.1 hypothetical protein FOMMEDRAFT_169910 [Fomitiporia mediterranea MF3/22]